MSKATVVFVGLLYAIAMLEGVTSQHEGDLRLIGGQNAAEGRVELFLMSKWNGVCDDLWSTHDAIVVCRQLNLPWSGALSIDHGEFEAGNRSYVIDDVQCDGDERQLLDCQHNTRPNCHVIGTEDAGVRCLEGSQPNYVNGSGEVRLVDGTGSNSGRVEINVNGNWSTVCDQFWSRSDAGVVCRELGFNITEHSAVSEVNNGGSLPTLVEKFLCLGNESRLMDCPHELIDGPHDCLHAGVTCLPIVTDIPEGSVRLVGSTMSGRLEILFNGIWGTVCDDGFTRYSAEVVCKQLNFTNTEGRVAIAAAGIGPIWLTDVTCIGNESSLLDCAHNSQTSGSCVHYEDVEVTCYNYSVCRLGDIRLVNGNSSLEGRIEMCYNDAWSTICHTSWESSGAQQVCRQLNLPSTAALPYRSAFFGEGEGTIKYDRVICSNPNGRTVFDDCSYRTSSFCPHSRDAGVRCESAESLSDDRIRLVGGRTPLEGRVEVLLDGKWGTICDDNGWNAAAATTVCRQLGFPTNGSIALYESAFGPAASDQPMHFNDVVCTGSEAGPQACIFSMDLRGCSHSKDASVICSAPPVPEAPEKFQIQLNSLECSKVTFSWIAPNNLQFQKLHHYKIRIVSLNAKNISKVTVPISNSTHTMDLECGSRYVGYITIFVLDTPGADSIPVVFKTNSAIMVTEETQVTTETIEKPVTAEKQVRELSSGGLAAGIVIFIVLLAIIAILSAAILVLCARDKRKFRIFGSHSKSNNVYGTNDCVFENELHKQSLESLHSDDSNKHGAHPSSNGDSNGDSAGLIQ